ncbi:MAG: hypothetical protein H6512_14130 [Acidimicrobiia bacterium]|nr:hypothetical protein [Acidimicrobiia bacterium]
MGFLGFGFLGFEGGFGFLSRFGFLALRVSFGLGLCFGFGFFGFGFGFGGGGFRRLRRRLRLGFGFNRRLLLVLLFGRRSAVWVLAWSANCWACCVKDALAAMLAAVSARVLAGQAGCRSWLCCRLLFWLFWLLRRVDMGCCGSSRCGVGEVGVGVSAGESGEHGVVLALVRWWTVWSAVLSAVFAAPGDRRCCFWVVSMAVLSFGFGLCICV